jgi:hypothetical protein
MEDLELTRTERIGKTILDTAAKLVTAIPHVSCFDPDYPSTASILEVPGRHQVATYTCGVIATWTILRGLGCGIAIREWSRRCHKAGCHPDEGMDIEQIAKALRSLRFRVYTHRYRSRNQVRRFIDAGQPLLFGTGNDMFGDGEGDHWNYLYGCSGRYVYIGNDINELTPFISKDKWGWKYFEDQLNPRELYAINS